VRVLGHERPRVELDDGESEAVAVNRAREDAVPDRKRVQVGEVVERVWL
jgi:hypothetical protein